MTKSKRGPESGQGLVEYALILVLIAVVAFAIFVWPIPKLWKRPPGGNGNTATATTEIRNESEIKEIIETGSIVQIVETETTSTNNCKNSSPTEIETQRIRAVEHVVTIEGTGSVSIDVPVLQLVTVGLEGKYGVQDKQTEQRSYTVKFITGPNRQAIHTVVWKYTWRSGNVIVRLPDESEEIYTYKVGVSLEPEITSTEISCDQMYTPAVSP